MAKSKSSDGEFYLTRVEHHVHKDNWCPVQSCRDMVELTGQLPFVIMRFPEALSSQDVLEVSEEPLPKSINRNQE